MASNAMQLRRLGRGCLQLRRGPPTLSLRWLIPTLPGRVLPWVSAAESGGLELGLTLVDVPGEAVDGAPVAVSPVRVLAAPRDGDADVAREGVHSQAGIIFVVVVECSVRSGTNEVR